MLTPAQMYLLNHACWPVFQAFEAVPYLVGSALTNPQYRDVDVRTVISDERYAAMFPGAAVPWTDPLWQLVCHSIGRQLSAATGLVVDFQVQSQAQFDEYQGRPRNPLAVFPTSRSSDDPQ